MRKRNKNAPRTSKKEKSKIKTEKQNTEQEKNNLIISENREGKACAYTNTQCIQYILVHINELRHTSQFIEHKLDLRRSLKRRG